MTARYVADEAALREALWGHTMVMRDTSEGAIFGCKCGVATGSHPDHLATALLASGVVQPREAAVREALTAAADDWQQGEWADAPRRSNRIAERMANAQHVTDWLRARAGTDRPAAEDGPRNTGTGSAT